MSHVRGQPVLTRPSPGHGGGDTECASNFYPIKLNNVKFTAVRTNFGNEKLKQKYALMNCSSYFFLSENGDYAFTLESTDAGGVSQVSLPMNRLFRLLMIRHSCLEGSVEFPLRSDLDRFALGGRLFRLRRAGSGWALVIGGTFKRKSYTTATLWDAFEAGFTFTRERDVVCLHGSPREYKVVSLSHSSAATQLVLIKGEEMTVAKYFESIVHVTLQHVDAPLGVDRKGRFLPLELCHLVEKISVEGKTCSELVAEINEFILKPIGMSVATEPLLVKAHRLLPPEQLSEPLVSVRACVVAFGTILVPKLENLLVVHTISVDPADWSAKIHAGLAAMTSPVDLFLVLTPTRLEAQLYTQLKCLFDLKLGVPSQVVVGECVSPSLCQQINLKLSEPKTKPPATCVLSVCETNLITGLVLSTNPGFNRFTAQARVGGPCFEEMLYELFIDFFRINGAFPARIVAFQRISSRNAFTVVSNELRGIHAVFSRLSREVRTGINPRLSPVEVQMPGLTLVAWDSDCFDFDKNFLVQDPRVLDPESLSFFVRNVHFEVLHDTNRFSPSEIVAFVQQLGPTAIARAKQLVRRSEMYVKQIGGSACLNQQLFDPDTLGGSMLARMTYI